MLTRILSAVAALVIFAAPLSVQADIPTPEGRVILEVSGEIEHGNASGEDGRPIARFDREMLMALPLASLETETDFTDGQQIFEGVLLADLLAHVGATGTDLRAIALNDYAVTIPMEDAQDYSVLLALLKNGEEMPVRTKGPIWVIYPFDDMESKRIHPHSSKMVWQLSHIVVN